MINWRKGSQDIAVGKGDKIRGGGRWEPVEGGWFTVDPDGSLGGDVEVGVLSK